MPIILFTGIAAGTLYMQSIENSVAYVPGSVTLAEAQNIETLSLVVVSMIAVFAAITLLNTLVAATIQRRREFAQQRLIGASPSQVLGMVGIEAAVLAAAGVFLGSIASLATIIPYRIARTGAILPDATILLCLGIVVVAVLLTLGSNLGAARRTIRLPAVDAIRP
jgi:ABC-type antimicrobial peptide transport system permease subunit